MRHIISKTRHSITMLSRQKKWRVLCVLMVIVTGTVWYSRTSELRFVTNRFGNTVKRGEHLQHVAHMLVDTTKHREYVRDYLGYSYPKGYFDVIPKSKFDFQRMDLDGRHSDTVMEECHDPEGIDPAKTIQSAGYIEPPKFLPKYKNPCWLDKEGQLTCVPYFFVIGTAKSGSTDLYYRIVAHPDVAMAASKEPRWFDKRRLVPKTSSLTKYTSNYRKSANEIQSSANENGYHEKICGDSSVSYCWDNKEWRIFPENQRCIEPRNIILSYIHHFNPEAKLIMILRNPVDRLYSHYLYHAIETGGNKTAEEFHDWVTLAVSAYKECFETYPFRACMYSKEIKNSLKFKPVISSIFSRVILDVLKIFPRKQLLILETDDYNRNMKERMTDIFDFLGLKSLSDQDMAPVIRHGKKNKGKYKAGPMLESTRRMLEDFYQPFNEELALMLDDDKYLWKRQETAE